jgi:hypothetical protein
MDEEIEFRCMDRERNGDPATGLVPCAGPDCPDYDQGWCIQIQAMGDGASLY